MQLFDGKGLAEKVVHAGLQASPAAIGCDVSGDGNDWDIASKLFHGPNALRANTTIYPRHAVVHEDYIEGEQTQHLHGLGARGGCVDNNLQTVCQELK